MKLSKYSRLLFLVLWVNIYTVAGAFYMRSSVKTINDVVALFPTTVDEMNACADETVVQVKQRIDEIIALDDHARTFENTVQAFDAVSSYCEGQAGKLSLLSFVHPDKELQQAAKEIALRLSKASVDHLSMNVDLYQAIKAYAQGNKKLEVLNDQEEYFLNIVLKDYQQSGLDLPQEQRDTIKALQKELSDLGVDFINAINTDTSCIHVAQDELAGIEQVFIESLQRSQDGLYRLGVDYPTHAMIMQNCSVAHTRKKLCTAFNNRAYPYNYEVLNSLIALRNKLAMLLGYKSYAHCDIDGQMAESPECVEQFLHDLVEKVQQKEAHEFEDLVANLPEGVHLTSDGKLQSWDIDYAKNYYKKKVFAIDEQKIAEYFPMATTIDGLLNIYEQFLSLRFDRVAISGLWSDEVQAIAVYKNNEGLGSELFLGYLLLDLFPRSNKFSHACQVTVVSARTDKAGTLFPAVSAVLANFPKSTGSKPALLKRSDATVFFHEFGHALHALLGSTQFATKSGTKVLYDFVELPSQMIQEWLTDRAILKSISCHYQTGEPLSDDIIDTLLVLKNNGSGYFVQRQIYLASLALALFAEGDTKNIDELSRSLWDQLCPHVAFDDSDHHCAAWVHLRRYGAKYYGYIWTKVFALDLFAKIRDYGLLNPIIGAEYVQKILSKGGCADPNMLLKDFLGREPNQQAFLRDMSFA